MLTRHLGLGRAISGYLVAAGVYNFAGHSFSFVPLTPNMSRSTAPA